MSWTIVAKKDFRDALRSRMLWGLTVLFVLFMAGIAYAYTYVESGGAAGELQSLGLLVFLAGPVTILVPITGLVVGHKAIAGEVESGSAKLLLSLPHSRRDAIIGKVLGRSLTLAVSILAGIAGAIVVVLALYDTFNSTMFVVFTALSLLLGVVYTSIGVGLSALTKDTGRATILAAGFFLLVEVVLELVPMGLIYIVKLTPGPDAIWPAFIPRLSPSNAYSTVLFQTFPETVGPGMNATSVYLSTSMMLVILLSWLVVVPLVGYVRFDRQDL